MNYRRWHWRSCSRDGASQEKHSFRTLRSSRTTFCGWVTFTSIDGDDKASSDGLTSAGIGFGPNGLQAMDLIVEGFRPKYEQICIGNKPEEARHVFFEGLLLKEGLGMNTTSKSRCRTCAHSSAGLGESWHGKSSWGHPNYTRSSVSPYVLLELI